MQHSLESGREVESQARLTYIRRRFQRWSKAGHLFTDLAWFSFALTIVSLPFRYRWVLLENPHPPIYKDYTDVLFFLSDGFVLATLVFWLASLWLAPRPVRLKPFFLVGPVFMLAVVGGLSAVRSIDPRISIYHTIRLLGLALLFLYVLNEIEDFSQLILPVSVQVFLQSVVGVGQVLHQKDLGLQFLGEYPLDPAWRGVSIVWAEGIRSLRAYGLTDHPNLLGGCLAFGLVVMAFWFIEAESRWRIPAAAVFALGGLTLLLTFSRAAWLAFGCAILFSIIALTIQKQTAFLLRFITLLLFTLILLIPFLVHNAPYIGVRLNQGGSFSVVSQEVQSLGERALLEEAAGEIFASRPLTGVGLGTFPLALRSLKPEFPTDYQPVHVALFEAASETGILGGLIFGILLAAPWLSLWLNRKRIDFSLSLIGATALLMALTIAGFFDYYTWLLAPGRLWQWIAWGLWGGIYWKSLHASD